MTDPRAPRLVSYEERAIIVHKIATSNWLLSYQLGLESGPCPWDVMDEHFVNRAFELFLRPVKPQTEGDEQ